jgi:secondary thiamine-phosphate synthase enzyme
MACFQKTLTIRTGTHNEMLDITERVQKVLVESGVNSGQCVVYTPHSTAAITINENADPNIGVDFLNALKKLVIEHDGWLHDRVDNNAAAHIKSALIGPSECLPVAQGQLTLGQWQNIFLCEFDGPRSRQVIVSILS